MPRRESSPAALDPTLRMRPFAATDQAAARALILAGLGEHFGLVDETCNPDLDDIATTYLAAGALFIVVERGGRLVATGAMRRDDAHTGSLVRMSVAPNERHRGVGRALVARLIASARSAGLRRLVVETNKDWYDAIGLYVACGFREFALDDVSIYLELPLEDTTGAELPAATDRG